MEKTKNKKSETEEKGQEDVVLSKAHVLEEFMGRTFVSLLDLRSMYEFPLKKRNGFPSLSMAEFKAWAVEYEVDNINPKKITTTMLEVRAREKRFATIEDIPLVGIDVIKNYVNKDAATIQSWHRLYLDCPIKKTGETYSVNARPLCVWMNKLGIEWGYGHHGRSTY
jgi:hypothetical protein